MLSSVSEQVREEFYVIIRWNPLRCVIAKNVKHWVIAKRFTAVWYNLIITLQAELITTWPLHGDFMFRSGPAFSFIWWYITFRLSCWIGLTYLTCYFCYISFFRFQWVVGMCMTFVRSNLYLEEHWLVTELSGLEQG